MQILELVLYGKNGDKRTLTFNPGRVNIITGKSKSGKSAVGDIIEYCMGGESCNVADGVVRENVKWYGLLLEYGSNRVFVARENPMPGQQTTSVCYYEIGNNVLQSPLRADFKPNTNVVGIEKILGNAIGITENLNIPDMDETRNPLEANIRHALFYCFQSQDEIAARNILFHRQNEPFISQAIKDSLPYFLGAVSEEEISLISEGRELKRNLKKLNRQLNEIQLANDAGTEKAVSLLTEAESVGLIGKSTGLADRDFNTIYEVLRTIKLETTDAPSDMLDKLSTLQTQLKLKEESLSFVQSSIDDVKTSMRYATSYGSEANHQKTRLESIGLFEKLNFDTGKCPLCSGDLNPEPAGVAAMKESIRALDRAIGAVEKEKPQLRRYLDKKEEDARTLKREISTLKAEIDGVYKLIDDEKAIKDLNSRQAKVYGRISYWLENVKTDEESEEISNKIPAIETRLQEIDDLIGNDSVKERMESSLSIISKDMTDWAEKLDMEFAGSPYRIDMGRVTVVADRERPIALREMGSASNWLGVHLITMFGLHKFFASKNRPVPGFIFLDQPSQVYFPENSDAAEDMDVQAVSNIYDFIEHRVEDQDGNLQVIVVDHASLDIDSFKEDTVEDWRDDNKNLVPVEWYKGSALVKK